MTNLPDTPSPTDISAEDLDQLRARRLVVKKMLTVAATAPMAALLFDPTKARADGTGLVIED